MFLISADAKGGIMQRATRTERQSADVSFIVILLMPDLASFRACLKRQVMISVFRSTTERDLRLITSAKDHESAPRRSSSGLMKPAFPSATLRPTAACGRSSDSEKR